MSIEKLGKQTASALQSLGLMRKPEAAPADPGVTPTAWDTEYGNIGHALLNVPFGEMIKSMGVSIANTQLEMDMVSARTAQVMAGMPITEDGPAFVVDFAGEKDLTLLELGFTPNFYQFTEAVIDVKMTMNFSSEVINQASKTGVDVAGGLKVPSPLSFAKYMGILTGGDSYSAHLNVSVANASTTAKYNMQAEGMSSLRTTMVPVPPPAPLEARMQAAVVKRNELKKLVASLDSDANAYKNSVDVLAAQVKTEAAAPAADPPAAPAP